MNISQAGRMAGLAAKTIRYYEEIGLIAATRRDNGYRDYSEAQVHELRFVARARSLGFTVEECRHLLSLYRDKARASADVREAARSHVATIRAKISELRAMEAALTHLIDRCAGDSRPDCPIIEGLSGDQAPLDQPNGAG